MTPHTTNPDNPVTPVQVSSTDVQLAVLNEKVSQVIGNHEKRITDLEARGKNWPTVVACLVGVCILILTVAGRIQWQ